MTARSSVRRRESVASPKGNTRRRAMHKPMLILAAIAILVYGCGGDSGTSPAVEEEQPLAADTIGADGGTMVIDDFELIVPAGAFDTDAELMLFDMTSDQEFGDNCASRFFRLEGLPAAFSESLTVRIGYEGGVGEDIAVAWGHDAVFRDIEGDSADGIAYDFVEAEESSGYIQAVLRAPAVAGLLRGVAAGSVRPAKRSYLAALREIRFTYATEHSKVWYPLHQAGNVGEIGGFVEAAYDTVVALGLGYEGKFWEWPVKVNIVHSQKLPVGFNVTGTDGFFIQIRDEFITAANMNNVGLYIGCVMAQVGQFVPNAREYYDGNHLAWHVAVRSWLQEKLSPGGEFVSPHGFSGKEAYALLGLPRGMEDDSEAKTYGAGWSAVIKHLVTRYGQTFVGDIYQITKSTDEPPVPVMMKRLPEPAYNWWPQFVDRYFTGGIYGVDGVVFLSAVPEDATFKIKSGVDTLAQFTRIARQVSAGRSRVNLDYSQISEGAALQLALDVEDIEPDWFTLLVYKAKDGVLQYLATGDTVMVSGLRDLTISGYDLLVADVLSYNEEPFTETARMSMAFRVIESPTFTLCKIRVGYTGEFQTEGDEDPHYFYIEPGWYADGTFSGNTFTGEIAQWHHGDNTTGSMTVTVDPATMTATYFSASAVTVDAYGTSRWSVEGHSLPRDLYTPGVTLRCKAEGTPTCFYISDIGWSYVPASGSREDLIEYACEANAYLELTFTTP